MSPIKPAELWKVQFYCCFWFLFASLQLETGLGRTSRVSSSSVVKCYALKLAFISSYLRPKHKKRLAPHTECPIKTRFTNTTFTHYKNMIFLFYSYFVFCFCHFQYKYLNNLKSRYIYLRSKMTSSFIHHFDHFSKNRTYHLKSFDFILI